MTMRSVRGVSGSALSGNARGLLIVCGLEIILFSLIFGLGWLASRASSEELFFHWRPGWWAVPLGIAYSLAIRIGLGVLAMVVIAILVATQVSTPEAIGNFANANRPNVETLVSIPALQNNPAYYWLSITLVSFVVAGLREEVWRAGTLAAMRALWPRAFASTGGQCAAVLLIAVPFGAMHLPMGPIAAALAGVLGCFLGLIIVLHRSIWPAVIAHGLFDATTFALLPLAMEKVQQLR